MNKNRSSFDAVQAAISVTVTAVAAVCFFAAANTRGTIRSVLIVLAALCIVSGAVRTFAIDRSAIRRKAALLGRLRKKNGGILSMDKQFLERFVSCEVSVRTLDLSMRGVLSEVGDKSVLIERKNKKGEVVATYCVNIDMIEAITKF